MKILLVEDNAGKAERVIAGLRAEIPEPPWLVEQAESATEAKRLLRSNYYDLVILDIALPLRKPEAPDPTGGIKLYREVLDREVYRRPGHVIGLTGVTDIYESAGAAFGPELWSLIYFDDGSDVWLDRLSGKVRHILSAERAREATSESAFDVALVVAVADELDQVRRNGWAWTKHDVPGDASLYFQADYQRADGRKARAILAKAPLMGMSAASILATKMGYNFRPKTIVMSGICAGDSDQVAMGDLVAANPAWDYGSGKHVGDATTNRFEPAPYQIPLSTRIRGLLERLEIDQAALDQIHGAFGGGKPTGRPALHVGPFASGAAVLANKALFTAIQEQQHRKLLGIDMEAYGVMSAAQELPYPQPECLVLKGVSDFADTEKGDKFRHYAAHASACAVTVLCERYNL